MKKISSGSCFWTIQDTGVNSELRGISFADDLPN